ncbi:lipid A ABC transporter permease/ATP-binding protein [Paenibacillus sp. J31TS4]|uniref:ABC transporter ATP-binding protein n=1 Tax=Paenibacillus sp. J31TS4 TaxID=2807195 RepID=UPI001B24B00D|nr:ABC transporter ATP-binding protein [Paenibacillus sp. J31TS4]GIP40758.1 lipid A ABC transporter permease/ATP-binding protein [Paenibacillus sp. J31TS4]
MNIHQERMRVPIKDSQLLSRLLAYAKPYWKMVLLGIVLAFLIVLTDLARPYLLKVAIDDHIGALHKPMLAVDAGREDLLAGRGSILEVDGKAYVRLPADAAPPPEKEGVAQRQIVEIGDDAYLIEGWLKGKETPAVTENPAGGVTLASGGQSYAGTLLSPEQTEAFRKEDRGSFVTIGLAFLAVVAAGSLLTYVQGNLLQYTGQSIIFNIRQQLFNHLTKLSMSYYDRNPAGRIVVRVTQDTEALNQLYSQVVVNLVKDVIVLIGILVIMLQMSVKLSLLAFAVLPVLAFMTFWYRSIIREGQRKARLILSRLNSFLAENLSGIRITQLFIREQRQVEQFDELNHSYYRAGMFTSTVNSIFQPAIGFLGNLAIALLIWYGGIHVIDGTITFGIVFAFTQYIRQFFQPLLSLAEKYNQIQTAMVGAERIFEMLDEKPGIVDSPMARPLQGETRGEIEFDHVWFAYNEGEWVLKDVSFKIEPGQTIAFVGATGAGKSSIIQLINRFYDIQQGSIRLDGVDIREIPLDDLRRRISVVQQDVFLFTGDIASNIRLNNEDISDRELQEAARMVHLDEFIRSQPDGFATRLGERGITLSLGQRQLLSFARAIAFKPQILILDEATSNIDTETELVVQDALQSISKGRTTVIVAHRLSTIQHADQIIVMHKGKVREMGNHYQLLARKGYYHRLFELQYKEQARAQSTAPHAQSTAR